MIKTEENVASNPGLQCACLCFILNAIIGRHFKTDHFDYIQFSKFVCIYMNLAPEKWRKPYKYGSTRRAAWVQGRSEERNLKPLGSSPWRLSALELSQTILWCCQCSELDQPKLGSDWGFGRRRTHRRREENEEGNGRRDKHLGR